MKGSRSRHRLLAACALGVLLGAIAGWGDSPAEASGDDEAPLRHTIVFHEPGRFGGWPANNGVWIWGDEILVGFQLAYYQDKTDDHSYDREKPSVKALARSLDGGQTWTYREHPELDLQDAAPSPGGIDFTHPDFALRNSGGVFHFSYDRGKTWQGPYELPTFGKSLTARTDYLVLGKDECLFFLSAKEPLVQAGLQDRAFCARTADGGKTFEFLSWMTGHPVAVRSVMPSTAQVGHNHLISALRRRFGFQVPGPDVRANWIDLYQSRDMGRSWEFLSKVAQTDPGNEGHRNGNPPSLVRLKDGRICVTYGYRGEPYGIRARISSDNGETWGAEIHLRDDGRTWDLGYTRTVQRSDGKLVTMYYYTTEERPEQHIAVTIWDPDRVSR